MTLTSFGNFGAKLQKMQYDVTHWSKCAEMF